MKSLHLSLPALSIIVILCSFSVDQLHHTPRLGDTIETYDVVGTLCNDSTNESVIWNFSEFRPSSKKYKLSIDSFADRPGQWVAVVKGCRHYFKVNGDTIFNMGYERPGRHFTFTEGQKPFFTFSSTISNSESTAYRATCFVDEEVMEIIEGVWMTSPWETGTLLTPDGDSIADATKIQVSMAHTIKMLPRFAADSTYKSTYSSQTKCISYWFANGYRYPIMIEKRLCHNGYHDKSSYIYIPIDVQECLDDHPNEIIRDFMAEKFNQKKCDSECPPHTKPYTCTIDDNEHVIRLDFQNMYAGPVEFVLADINGIVYQNGRKILSDTTESIIDISFANLPSKGYYVVYIALGSESFFETFTK